MQWHGVKIKERQKKKRKTLRKRSYVRESVTPASVKTAAKQKNFKGPNGNEAVAYQWIWSTAKPRMAWSAIRDVINQWKVS